MTNTPTNPTESSKEVPLSNEAFRLWEKYEEITMHFNELIMRWRLQAIGGLVALVMAGGAVVKDLAEEEVRYWASCFCLGRSCAPG